VRDEILDPAAGDDDLLMEPPLAGPDAASMGATMGEEAGLRPRRLADFVGQSELKDHLGIILEAARRRGQAADHLLFAGPPGLGKTTLSGIVAAEMEVDLHVTSGPAIERAGDLAAILTRLGEGDVLFVDEIHRLSRTVEEVLYPAMEDFQLDIVLGKGPAARSLRLDLPRFTLVGATTRTGLITGPLRDRFGLVARLDYYDPADLTEIVLRAAGILGVTIDADGATEIAGRARGTPRIANRLLRRVRDFAEVRASGDVNRDVAMEGLALFGVDQLGLDKVDRAILTALCTRFGGGPVGLSTLAIGASEPAETVEDVYEPFLIGQGLLLRTPRGRVATPAAWAHLGLLMPASAPLAVDDDGQPRLID
jgi:Holliday junction DNA helicase RuvB